MWIELISKIMVAVITYAIFDTINDCYINDANSNSFLLGWVGGTTCLTALNVLGMLVFRN